MIVQTPCINGKTGNESRCARGFTLIEILVALAIIAILSGLVYPMYQHYLDKAKVTLAISTLETVRKIMEGYHIDHGSYPAAVDFATGRDDQGQPVLEGSLLSEFKRNIYSLESYTIAAGNYTMNVRAQDTTHTVLILTPGQVVIKGQ